MGGPSRKNLTLEKWGQGGETESFLEELTSRSMEKGCFLPSVAPGPPLLSQTLQPRSHLGFY